MLPFFLVLSSADAQVPPDGAASLFELVQDERVRGAIYSVPIDGTCHYTEYWYLSTEYVYPSRESGASIRVNAVEGGPENLDAFVKTMREAFPGGTLVTVDNIEHRADCR